MVAPFRALIPGWQERVVDMTDAYWAPKCAAQAALKAQAKRAAEDAEFLKALATMNDPEMGL